eukprot:TRINITY_DN17112_c0_g1_i1.p1 TRINITY_DN17112_c0_g1~~TRINITY_DN17112_c0_g1_i1.p1  ORF type:complete len:202 (+),score=38.13 TRINITY_DN17112_c0_g1_i1:77-607(+)
MSLGDVEYFKVHGIIPDVLSEKHTDFQLIEVEYPHGVHVEGGNVLQPEKVKDQPHVTYPVEPDSFYTVILTDPDARTSLSEEKSEWKHWLVVNIPGADVHKGEALAEYFGPAPPPGTGLHRYVFLVAKQPGKLTFEGEPRLSKADLKRSHFKADAFLSHYHLKLIGANFFQAEYDD